MFINKIAPVLLFVSLLQGAPKALAHEGSIIFLPVILTYEVLDLVAVNARTGIKGFWAVGSRDYSENGLDLIHKKSNTVYSFNKARSLAEAKEACARVLKYDNPARLATPEEVRRLYTLRGIDRIGMFIMTKEKKSYVVGFYDGESNYFNMHVKSKELTLVDRPDSTNESPVVCVRPLDKEPNIFEED